MGEGLRVGVGGLFTLNVSSFSKAESSMIGMVISLSASPSSKTISPVCGAGSATV